MWGATLGFGKLNTSFKKVWWTIAAYGRVTNTSHEPTPREVYGKVWFRTMIGYDL